MLTSSEVQQLRQEMNEAADWLDRHLPKTLSQAVGRKVGA
jgi:hypothetical protein